MSEILDNTLSTLWPRRAFPKVSLEFADSHGSVALQACDVLANVLHGHLRFMKGLRTRNVEARKRILDSCLPGFSPPQELLQSLGTDTGELVGVKTHASLHQINPGPQLAVSL